jgi:hypothetical protein
VIDAHPENIDLVDFVRPDGTRVMRTPADYRQLNDALFHAGLRSGSQYEWEDAPNRLHFYVVDVQRSSSGILSYVIGVRSLDGRGSHTRGVELQAPARHPGGSSPWSVRLTNTGKAAPDAPSHVRRDIYRLSVDVEGVGWSAYLQNALAAVPFGETRVVSVYVMRNETTNHTARVTLTAVSESDPSKRATVSAAIVAPR